MGGPGFGCTLITLFGFFGSYGILIDVCERRVCNNSQLSFCVNPGDCNSRVQDGYYAYSIAVSIYNSFIDELKIGRMG